MFISAYDLKNFYATRGGRLVRRLLQERVAMMWPDTKSLRVAGYGYTTPYLWPLRESAERVFALMPDTCGAHAWPEKDKNLVTLINGNEWPLETESIDRIIIVHGLEQTHHLDALLQEAWRVLKSNGRILIAVPNRLGFWARADWTPFGHGTPYTPGQLTQHLQGNLFVHERTEKALFMPPFRSFLVLRTAYFFESLGRTLFPGLAGVHLIEASKQVYAGAGRGRVATNMGKRILFGKAVPTA